MVQDGIQLSGLLVVDQALRVTHDNPAVTMLEAPLLAVVDLGVAAVTPEGVTDADAQRVLVRLAGAVAAPFEDPGTFARTAAPIVVRGLLATAPTDDELRTLIDTHTATTWTDTERARLVGWVARVGLDLVVDATFARHGKYDVIVSAEQRSALTDVAAVSADEPFAESATALLKALAAKPVVPGDLASALQSVAVTTNVPAIDAVTARLGLLPTVVPLIDALARAIAANNDGDIAKALAALSTSIAGSSNARADTTLGVQCAAGIALAVASECQAQEGCDARAIADLLGDPTQSFDTGICDLEAVGRLYHSWGRADDFVASSLDILQPPRDATPRSQAVSVTGLVFDLADLVVAAQVELTEGPQPRWVDEVRAASGAGRKVFTEAMNGDAKTALTSLVAYVAERAPTWLGSESPEAVQVAQVAALLGATAPTLEDVIRTAGHVQDPKATAAALAKAYADACKALPVPKPAACTVRRDLEKAAARVGGKDEKALYKFARTAFAPAFESLLSSVLAAPPNRKTANLLSRTVAFGVFASDFAAASTLTDGKARKDAQKQAVRALSRSTTDRTRRRSDHVASVGGTVGPAAGVYLGDIGDEALASQKGLGGLPLSVTMGFSYDQVPTERTHWGWHAGVTLIELGRLVDWNPAGDATIGVTNPSDILRIGGTYGATFGRPNVPLYLGVQGWWDPRFATDVAQTADGFGAYVLFGFYVPLFDFN